MEIKPPTNPNPPQTPMKNLLVKLLPLLAIVIATPAFAGSNDEHHDRSNRYHSYGEHRDRDNRSHETNRRDEYVKVKVVERKYYSPRDHHQEGHREARRHHEYRGHHDARGHRDNYSHR
jgi:Ni/Co efflux regulator RcnB